MSVAPDKLHPAARGDVSGEAIANRLRTRYRARMANMNIVSGRSPTQADALVSADQVTIVGDGTKLNPLRAVAPPVLVPVIASARVTAGATFVAQKGFLGVSLVLPGVFTLTLENPPADTTKLAVVVTQLGVLAGMSSAASGPPNLVGVTTRDGAGAVASRDFMVTVYDLT